MDLDKINRECRLCQNKTWETFTKSCCRCQTCFKDYLIFEEVENSAPNLAFEVIFLKENFDQNNQITFDYINNILAFDGCKLDDKTEVAFTFDELNHDFSLENIAHIRDVHNLIG